MLLPASIVDAGTDGVELAELDVLTLGSYSWTPVEPKRVVDKESPDRPIDRLVDGPALVVLSGKRLVEGRSEASFGSGVVSPCSLQGSLQPA